MSDSEFAIRVRGLGKKYVIAHDEETESTLAEAFLASLRRRGPKPTREEFWAVRDVGFDVPRGDVVGVVGRNGAGKSTLLKLLSQITEPTTGEIQLFGRVGSLLEVGTGFHPELTGRENIFLNGAILGMTHAEVRRHFDAIVEFAGVEKFLDTPVKRYSSGMYVRLAFAVAAHLDTEILIVDEVLAVGDAEFQRKCLGKMRDVATGGRTVLFVSHNIPSVQTLCNKCILLDRGTLKAIGDTQEVLHEYLMLQAAQALDPARFRRPKGAPAWIRDVRITDSRGFPCSEVEFDGSAVINVEIELADELPHVQVGVRLYASSGAPVTTITDSDAFATRSQSRPAGIHRLRAQLPPQQLLPDDYRLQVAVHSPEHGVFHNVDEAAAFTVSTVGAPFKTDTRMGVVAMRSTWTEERTADS